MTINPPGFRTIVLIAVGFALIKLSGSLELSGDLSDVAGTRLTYHLSALLALIAALGCFVWGLKTLFFEKRDTPPAAGDPPEKAPQNVDIYPEEAAFDPDAVIARYMNGRGDPGPGDAPATKPGGFGRKGL